MSYIPDNILYVCKASQKITPKFDEVEESFFNARAFPAFPVDPAKEKTVETARSWAKGNYWKNQTEVHKEVQVPNDPIKLQLIDLHVRSQGGRAWKVIAKGEFYVDLREDILLEAILTCGVEKNGIINGEFIWTRQGSHMKLVRVGSALYDIVKESDSKKDQKKVGIKDLKPGNVYANNYGDWVFLGFVNSATINIDWNYHRRPAPTKNKPCKMQLWYDISPIKWAERKKKPSDILSVMKDSEYYLDIVKSKTVYPISDKPMIKLPNKLIEEARQIIIHKAKDMNIENEPRYFSYAVMAEYPNQIVLEGKYKNWWDGHDEK